MDRILAAVIIVVSLCSILAGFALGRLAGDSELLKENARLRGRIDKIITSREDPPRARPSGPSLFDD